MTPTQLETLARQQYNAVGDTFYSSSELQNYMTDAQMQLAMETNCLRNIYTTTTVDGQREYSAPTNLLAIKRVECNGERLLPIDFKDDDIYTMNRPDTTDEGAPAYYTIWDDVLYLRPTPDTTGQTIKIFAYAQPQDVSTVGSLEVPSRYHIKMVDYLLYRMALKDENHNIADRYDARWQQSLKGARMFERKLFITDGFKSVKESLDFPRTDLGTVYGV